MKQAWGQKLAYSRFQGLMASAKTPEEFDAIAKDLTDKDSKWQDVFGPEQFRSTLDEIVRSKAAFVTTADAQARAALESAEARTHDLVTLDPAEITQINEMAMRSNNPTTIKRAMRLQRNQQILDRSSKLPASELSAEANRVYAGGYPGMPVEVNTAINKAVTVFPSVSASYLGGNAIQEYGKYLPRNVIRKGDQKFLPRTLSGNVDLRMLKPEALNATILAGEIYGQPLNLISAVRSKEQQNALRFAPGKDPNRISIARDSRHTEGDAIDISIVGMSGAEKGKLVNSLLQAGFTGFGEYSTHIHADMRSTTPETFDPQRGWLGWSKASPEVMAELVARGYGANMDASKIIRGSAAMTASKPADYAKGADGGATSAVGIGMWTEQSFLGVMRNPKIAARVGLPDNLTDAQVLELRKDPTWSMFATAAYAEQNKKVMEASLQRTVTDAEMYMAHFLGPTGAMVLISSYTNNPNAIAADVLPKAAKNNPPRFYENAGIKNKFVQGKPLTVKDAYDEMTLAFSNSPSQIQYEDAKQYELMASAATKAQSADPMTHYSNNVAPVNDLNVDGGYAARGAVATAAANLYKIPVDEMKPFTADEASDLIKRISEGTAEQKLAVMRDIQLMEQSAPGMSNAAYTQLGQKDTVLDRAAGLANFRGDEATAELIIRGQQRLKDDKQFEGTLFEDKKAANVAFNEVTDGALLAIPAVSRNAIFEAAKALYAEQSANKGLYEFDTDRFKIAVQQVVGGATATPGLAEVNGKMTMLPPGLTAETFDTAINNMTDSDLLQFSSDGNPPITVEGDNVNAADIAREGEFVYIGAKSYVIRMNDGNTLTTGERLTNGTVRAFVFEAEIDEMKLLASRPRTNTGALPPTGEPEKNPFMLPLGAGETAPAKGWDEIP